jgi:hypothetical protein
MTRKFLMVTALVAGVAATADAQLCTGSAPFSAGRMRLGVGAEFPEGAKAYGGNLTYAHSSGVYLGGGINRWDEESSPDNALEYGANLGYEMSFDAMPKLRFCPMGRFSLAKGPEVGTSEVSTTRYGFGAAVGGVLSSSDNMAIVPSLAINWIHASVETPAGGGSTTVEDSWMEATLGTGFVINRSVTFTPTVHVPLNQDGAEARWGFSLSYNFGRPGGVSQQGRRRR